MRYRFENSHYDLQLTAMVDMFTIILIFLLRSYSVSAVQLTPADNIRLPASFSASQPIEALKLVVAKHGIYVEDQKITDLIDGKISASQLDRRDPNFIKVLFSALDEQAKKSQGIAKANTEVRFDGKLILQADSEISYSLLKKVMYTSTLAGFNDIKMAAVLIE